MTCALAPDWHGAWGCATWHNEMVPRGIRRLRHVASYQTATWHNWHRVNPRDSMYCRHNRNVESKSNCKEKHELSVKIRRVCVRRSGERGKAHRLLPRQLRILCRLIPVDVINLPPDKSSYMFVHLTCSSTYTYSTIPSSCIYLYC